MIFSQMKPNMMKNLLKKLIVDLPTPGGPHNTINVGLSEAEEAEEEAEIPNALNINSSKGIAPNGGGSPFFGFKMFNKIVGSR